MNIDEKQNSVIQFMHKATELITRMGDDTFIAIGVYLNEADKAVFESMTPREIEILEKRLGEF